MKCLNVDDRPCVLEVLKNIVNPCWGDKPVEYIKGIVDTAVEADTDLAFLVTIAPVEDKDNASYCMSVELCRQNEYVPIQYMKKGSFLVNQQNCDNTLSRVADRIIAYTAEVD